MHHLIEGPIGWSKRPTRVAMLQLEPREAPGEPALKPMSLSHPERQARRRDRCTGNSNRRWRQLLARLLRAHA